MTRVASGFCVAALLSSVVSLGAQTPTTSTASTQRASADTPRELTITGCLSKSADGRYILTNAKLDNPASATAGTSGTSTTTTSPNPATTTGAPATAGTSTTTAGAASAATNVASSWALSGGTDLDKHVGHRIQVVGKAAMDTAMDRSRTPDTTTAAAPGTPATGAVGTTGSTATAATEEQRNRDMNANQPRLDVQSVKMIAASCS